MLELASGVCGGLLLTCCCSDSEALGACFASCVFIGIGGEFFFPFLSELNLIKVGGNSNFALLRVKRYC